jgi:hypothetical protein
MQPQTEEDWRERAACVSMLRRYGRGIVSRELGLSLYRVQKIGAEEKVSQLKRGRGRRISVELRDEIIAGIRADRRVVDLKREFRVSEGYLVALRHGLGDTRDHRKPSFRKRNLSAADRELLVADIRNGVGQKQLAKKWHMHTTRIQTFIVEVGCPRPTMPRTQTVGVLPLSKTEMTPGNGVLFCSS